MAWKIEPWFADVHSGEAEILAEYRGFPPRELAIVSAAVLDVAVAELQAMRLAGHSKVVAEFLGVNGGGRAPVGLL